MIVMKQSHKLGMSEEDVKDALFSLFEVWHTGQTYAIHPKTGKPLYYKHDVAAYIGMIEKHIQKGGSEGGE